MSSATTYVEKTPFPAIAIDKVASGLSRIARLPGDWRKARSRRRSVSSLKSLDARVLADIGMSRSEITSIVYTGGDGERRRSHEGY
jgi:uncharacterized protein YjiS (DUF1127 family)